MAPPSGRCSDLNQTHILRINGLWEIPWPHTEPGVGRVLGGWRLAGIVSKLSGRPLNVVSGTDVALVGTSRSLGAQRPDAVARPGSEYFRRSIARREDRKVVQHRGIRSTGDGLLRQYTQKPNQGSRVVYRGCVAVEALPVLRHRKRNFEFRVEAFNLLNTVNLGTPVLTLTASNFGQIITAADGRVGAARFQIRVLTRKRPRSVMQTTASLIGARTSSSP